MQKTTTVKYALAIVIFLITCSVYLPALQNGFVDWDDNLYVSGNPRIRSLDGEFFQWAFTTIAVSNWHPLTWVSHAVDHALWGLNPAGHHLTSIILHGLNTVVVFFLSLGLAGSLNQGRSATHPPGEADGTVLTAAGVAGLLFGLHPLHVEAVAWIAERKELLCTFFFLLSIASYGRYAGAAGSGDAREEASALLSNRHFAAALAFFVLALLSKPMAVSLPAVLLFLDWHPFARFGTRRAFLRCLREKVPFLALSAAVSAITIIAQQRTIVPHQSVHFSERLLVGAKALITYLGKLIVPTGLLPYYPYPEPREVSLLSFEYAFTAALAIGITLFAFALRKREKLGLMLWGSFVVTLLPVIGLVQVGSQAMADRYTYLPGVAFFLAVGLLAARTADGLRAMPSGRPASQIAAAAAAAAVLISLAIATVHQTGIWKNSLTLWDQVIYAEPDAYFAYNQRGFAHAQRKEFDRAFADFSQATVLRSDYADAHNNLGNTYMAMGHPDKAIAAFRTTILLDPENAEAYSNMGNAYADQGRFDEALEAYRSALVRDPRHAVAYNNLGILYLERGRIENAVDAFRAALDIDPYYAKAHVNLGRVYVLQGLIDGAIGEYTRALRSDPDLEDARRELQLLKSR